MAALSRTSSSRKRTREEIALPETFKLTKGSLVFRVGDADAALGAEGPDLACRVFLSMKAAQTSSAEGKSASGDEQAAARTPAVFRHFLQQQPLQPPSPPPPQPQQNGGDPSPAGISFHFTPHSHARLPQVQRKPRVMEFQTVKPLQLCVLSRDRHLRAEPMQLHEWGSQHGADGCISDPQAPEHSLITLCEPSANLKLIDDSKKRGVSQTLISDMFAKMSIRKSLSAQHQNAKILPSQKSNPRSHAQTQMPCSSSPGTPLSSSFGALPATSAQSAAGPTHKPSSIDMVSPSSVSLAASRHASSHDCVAAKCSSLSRCRAAPADLSQEASNGGDVAGMDFSS